MRTFNTIKDYDDEIKRLKDRQYLLMLEKFPVGSMVEYYRKSVLERAKVIYHSKDKCIMMIQKEGMGKRLCSWVSAIMCEPENPIECRTINCGYKSRKGKEK